MHTTTEVLNNIIRSLTDLVATLYSHNEQLTCAEEQAHISHSLEISNLNAAHEEAMRDLRDDHARELTHNRPRLTLAEIRDALPRTSTPSTKSTSSKPSAPSPVSASKKQRSLSTKPTHLPIREPHTTSSVQ